MRKYIDRFIAILAAAVAAGSLVACDSFLDRQEDEQLTFEKIWSQVSTTRQYFFNCMGYMPKDFTDVFGSYGNGTLTHTWASTDEATFCWSWGYRSINFGSWNASNMPNSTFNRYYEAIRDCNIFLQNVLDCSDTEANPSDLQLWYNSVRWVRAYYYFLLMRDFGPVFLMWDDLVDPGATISDLTRPRNTWEECVDYVVSEMEYCAARLPESHNSSYMGLPTKGAALGVISRLKLYSARDLFNGNALYRGVVNPDRTPLFPREFDAQKWVAAAQAAKAVIDLGLYSLHRDESGDPYLNYMGIMHETWNSELIFTASGFRSSNHIAFHTTPTDNAIGSIHYGGFGPTQQQVDAYAMANGRYPITGYQEDGTPKIDGASGYSANEFAKESFANPYLQAIGVSSAVNYRGEWPVMYKDREPRFYVCVFWGDSDWKYADNYVHVSFANGANGHNSHDYPYSGYLCNRYIDHSTDPHNGFFFNITFPTIRLGEIYLNYIEAVLECEKNGVSGEGVDHAAAMRLWDELRARSGMAPITEAYPGASTTQLIDLVRKERRVELAFEGHRYYDTRTWMIATQTDNGPMYGMDTMTPGTGTATPETFWVRKAFENRVFKNNHYLFPFPQRELDRNKQLVQNYGW